MSEIRWADLCAVHNPEPVKRGRSGPERRPGLGYPTRRQVMNGGRHADCTRAQAVRAGGPMASRGQWGFAPDSGGVKISDSVKHRTEARLRRYAEEHFAGRYTRLDIRFRGQLCYVDAYVEPEPLGPDWPPPDWPETREA